MDGDTAIKWIEALRIGNYKQGYGALRTVEEDGTLCHCAVGVLADVIDPNAWTRSGFATMSDSFPPVYWNRSSFGIPKPILEEHGIDYQVVNEAMNINDDKTHNFDQIADYLEEALAGTQIAG